MKKKTARISNNLSKNFLEQLELKGLSKTTKKKYMQHLNAFHTFVKKNKKPTEKGYEFSSEDFEKYLLNPKRGSRLRSLPKAFIRIYASCSNIPYQIPKQTGTTGIRQFQDEFKNDNFEELIHEIEKNNDYDLSLILRLGRMTGMRKGELLKLKWDDIDIDELTISIKKAKRNKFRIVFINQEMCEELRKYFLNKPIGYKLGDIYKYDEQLNFKLYEYLEKIEFNKKVGPHVICRHTFASDLRRKGMPLEDIKDLLGHESINTTMIYAHLDTKKLREKLEKFGGI